MPGYDIFLFTAKKGSQNTKKTRRLSKEEIKQQLIVSIINNDIIETRIKWESWQSREPRACCCHYKTIWRHSHKKENIITIAYHLGKVFKKFKDKFVELVNEFKIHKGTIIFKINIVKLIDKHSIMMKSSVTIGFLKNYYKDIKQICNENPNEFE